MKQKRNLSWLNLFSGTSNWTEDYFTTTAGQGFVFEPVIETSRDRDETEEEKPKYNLRDQLEQIFHRDWNSKLASPFK
jgi:phospholipase D3/4